MSAEAPHACSSRDYDRSRVSLPKGRRNAHLSKRIPPVRGLELSPANAPLKPLAEQFLTRKRLRWRAIAGYRQTFEAFDAWRAGATLADLNPRTVKEFVDRYYPRSDRAAPYTARNKLVAFKSLAAYLAAEGEWYEGHKVSVLAGTQLPPIPKLGRKPYEDREIRDLIRLSGEGPLGLRDRAVVTLQLATTLRADETRTLLLRHYVPGNARELGHILVRQSKTEAGIREVPLDPAADRALAEYLHYGRAAYRGTAEENLFLTERGQGFTYWGWGRMAARLKKRLDRLGFHGFQQHRARGTAAKLLQRRGVPLNVIQQIGGWEIPEMPRRYIGDYSIEELKAFPTAGLDEMLNSLERSPQPKAS
jgi:integrase